MLNFDGTAVAPWKTYRREDATKMPASPRGCVTSGPGAGRGSGVFSVVAFVCLSAFFVFIDY